VGERVRRLSAREVQAVLRQYGFTLVSQKGSHQKWRDAQRGLQVIVPDHQGKPLPLGTMLAIMKGAEIPEAEYRG
jgi:predicted RNA binding protein YcfA (HicA-like mRNA interferase family)